MQPNLFDIKGKVVVITGGYGILCGSIAQYLVSQGATVVLVGRNSEKGASFAKSISAHFSLADVLNEEQLRSSCADIVERFGTIDVLINGAGGNMPGATITPDQTLFDLQFEGMEQVVDLNLMGSVKPTIVYGEVMAKKGVGSIINISSMTAQSVVTRVLGYSVAKAAIDSFTKWSSVEMAKKFGEGVRVNAIAPGFFLTEQNRTLLTNPDGSYTPRAVDIVNKTPFARMGLPEELSGVAHFLASDASKFVTGTVIPVDGGFSVFSGV